MFNFYSGFCLDRAIGTGYYTRQVRVFVPRYKTALVAGVKSPTKLPLAQHIGQAILVRYYVQVV